MYQVRLKPSAEKSLAKLSKRDQRRIGLALLGPNQNPFVGKKLQGEYKGYYSIRVWPYRVIYGVMRSELVVIVIAIGRR